MKKLFYIRVRATAQDKSIHRIGLVCTLSDDKTELSCLGTCPDTQLWPASELTVSDADFKTLQKTQKLLIQEGTVSQVKIFSAHGLVQDHL